MILDIKEIKDIRKKLGLTQSQLANLSSVSQSLIAKIEAGRLDPTYSNAIKIFDALTQFGEKKGLKAEEIMNIKIISITPDSNIRDAILKMRKNSFSQLPVIHDHKAIGMISEASLLDSLLEKKGNSVSDVMDSPPPIISFDAGLDVVTNLLKYFQMVLVSKKGNLIGVITKTDLIGKVYH